MADWERVPFLTFDNDGVSVALCIGFPLLRMLIKGIQKRMENYWKYERIKTSAILKMDYGWGIVQPSANSNQIILVHIMCGRALTKSLCLSFVLCWSACPLLEGS